MPVNACCCGGTTACPSINSYAVAFHIEIIVYPSTDGSCTGTPLSDNNADVATTVYGPGPAAGICQCGYDDLFSVDPDPAILMKTYTGLGSYLAAFMCRNPSTLAWYITLDHSGVPEGYGNADTFGGGATGPSPLPTSGSWSGYTQCNRGSIAGGWVNTDFKVIVTGVTVS